MSAVSSLDDVTHCGESSSAHPNTKRLEIAISIRHICIIGLIVDPWRCSRIMIYSFLSNSLYQWRRWSPMNERHLAYANSMDMWWMEAEWDRETWWIYGEWDVGQIALFGLALRRSPFSLSSSFNLYSSSPSPLFPPPYRN